MSRVPVLTGQTDGSPRFRIAELIGRLRLRRAPPQQADEHGEADAASLPRFFASRAVLRISPAEYGRFSSYPEDRAV